MGQLLSVLLQLLEHFSFVRVWCALFVGGDGAPPLTPHPSPEQGEREPQPASA